jgi:hypothetical protein
MHGQPDEKNDIIRIQAAVELDLRYLQRSKDSIRGGLGEELV